MKIIITFKEKEKPIYDEICKHSSKTGFIKDILKSTLDSQSSVDKPSLNPK